MIRFLIIVLVVVGFLILLIPVLFAEWLIGKWKPEVKSKSSLKIVQAAFRLIIFLTGSKVTVKGRENIPEDQPVLYVGNHQSYFDIVIGYTLIKGECGFIAKKEMEKIPLLSLWMKNLHCLFLDRSDIKAGLKTILTAIDSVKKGISIWIFPEGTRSKTPGQMLPFKEGSMKIAEKSGCLIIPVAITGTPDIFERHIPLVKKSQVTFRFGTAVDLKSLDKEQKKFLGAYIQEIIRQMLLEEQNSPSA